MNKTALIITSTAAPGKRQELFELYQEFLAPRVGENEAQEVVVWCADQQDQRPLRSAGAVGIEPAVPGRDELRTRIELGLGQDRVDVVDHGRHRDAEPTGDLVIGVSSSDHGGDLLFSRCEAGQAPISAARYLRHDTVGTRGKANIVPAVVHCGDFCQRQLQRSAAHRIDEPVDGLHRVSTHPAKLLEKQ